MRIDSGLSSLSQLQAKQAFGPAPSKRAVQQQPEDDGIDLRPSLQQTPASESFDRPAVKSAASKLNLPTDEIRDIARRAGYLDVSDADIRHAYVYGESLLSDYRV